MTDGALLAVGCRQLANRVAVEVEVTSTSGEPLLRAHPGRCSRCGFVPRHEGTLAACDHPLASLRAYCPPCRQVTERRLGAWSFILLVLTAGLGTGLLFFPDGEAFGWALLNIALLPCLFACVVTLHETGHVVAGRLLGWEVERVTVGRGPLWWCFTVRGVKVFVHAIGWSAQTVTTHRPPLVLKCHHQWYAMAGPVVDLLMVVVICGVVGFANLWMDVTQAWRFGVVPLPMLLMGHLVSLARNLLPGYVRVAGGTLPNDGWRLREIAQTSEVWRQSDRGARNAQVMELLRTRQFDRAMAVARTCDRSGMDVPGLVPYCYLKSGRICEARSRWVALLENGGRSDAEKALLKNNIAWCDLLLGDPHLLDEALDYSCEALAASPGQSCFQGTRGAALVEAGEDARGLELLQESFDPDQLPDDKAVKHCYVAMGEHRRGRLDVAEEQYQMALSLDPQCPILQRCRRVLDGRP